MAYFQGGAFESPLSHMSKEKPFCFSNDKTLQEQHECKFKHIYSTVIYTLSGMLWRRFAVISYLFVNLYDKVWVPQKQGTCGIMLLLP